MAPGQIYVAKESAAVDIDGRGYQLIKGVTLVRAGHPLAKAAAAFLVPIDEHVHYDVQHDAKDGETRKAPRKRSSAKKAAATKAPEPAPKAEPEKATK